MDRRNHDDMSRSNGIESVPPASRRVPIGRGTTAPRPPERYRYAIGELADETGVSARTIRYYVGQGLLAPAYGRGPSATYDLGHLLRLRLIQHLKEQRNSLNHIKDLLARMTDAEIERMLGVESRPPEDVWRRIRVGDALEIHVRERPGQEPAAEWTEAVDGIAAYARSALDHIGRQP